MPNVTWPRTWGLISRLNFKDYPGKLQKFDKAHTSHFASMTNHRQKTHHIQDIINLAQKLNLGNCEVLHIDQRIRTHLGAARPKRQRRTVMLYIQVYQAILCQNNNFIAQLHLYGCLYRFLMAGAVQVAANFLVKPVDGHCPGFVPSYLP